MSAAEDMLLSAFTAQLAVSGEMVMYKTNGAGPGTAISAIVERRIPDVIDVDGTRAELTWTLRVLDADVSAPTDADVVTIDGRDFQVVDIGIKQGGHRELAIRGIDQQEWAQETYRGR